MTVKRKNAQTFGHKLPAQTDQIAAQQLRRLLANLRSKSGARVPLLRLNPTDPSEILLSPQLTGLLLDLLDRVSRGEAVTLFPLDQLLSTQQAAEMLNVSRKELITLLDRGEIQFSMLKRTRRIQANELFAYMARQEQDRAAALDELMQSDADLV